MRLTISLLRGIAEAIQAEAVLLASPAMSEAVIQEQHESWAYYQDAADALQDLADHVAVTERG